MKTNLQFRIIANGRGKVRLNGHNIGVVSDLYRTGSLDLARSVGSHLHRIRLMVCMADRVKKAAR